MKQRLTEMKRGIDNSKIILGDWTIPLLIMNRITGQMIKKKHFE